MATDININQMGADTQINNLHVDDLISAIQLIALAGGTFTGTITITGGINIVLNATTGTKIGTATTQKLGFYDATPVVQPAGSTDIAASLVTLGLRGATSNPALNIGTGAVTCGAIGAGGNITIADTKNIIVNATTGTQVGTATTQKLGFWGAAPIVQPASADQAACPAGGTGAAAGGWDTAGHRDSAILLINAMRTALVNAGLMKGAA